MLRKKQIDKYIIMTISRSIKRQWASLGGNIRAGIPYERIHFSFGEDAQNYGNDMKRVADAAADDGYPFLRQFALGLESTYVKQSAGNVALFWNWAKVLKWISQSGETCAILWDDRILDIEHEILERFIYTLRSRDEEFYILQLRLRGNSQHLSSVNHPAYPISAESNLNQLGTQFERMDTEIESDRRLFKGAIQGPSWTYFDTFLTHGIWGWDESMVLSPAGAKWLLSMMQETKDISEFLKTFDTSQLESHTGFSLATNLHPCYRSRMNNDNWLYCAPHLREGIKNAIADGKGLYSPRKIGYEFVNEPLNLITDVHWNTATWANPDIAKIRSLW